MLNKLRFNDKDDNVTTVAPAANIYEQDKDIVLALEMPGADKNSLEISLNGDILSVKGKNQKEDIAKEYKALYQERRQVEYQRNFELNVDVDREKLKAEYADGILKVFMTKSEKAQPRKIEIKA